MESLGGRSTIYLNISTMKRGQRVVRTKITDLEQSFILIIYYSLFTSSQVHAPKLHGSFAARYSRKY